MPPVRTTALLTIDLPTRLQPDSSPLAGLRPVTGAVDLQRQLRICLATFERCDARATFFVSGKSIPMIEPGLWTDLTGHGHRVGCLGFEGRPVSSMTPDEFREDARSGRRALEDVVRGEVVSFRAPDLSSDGCDPWFGAGLAEAGFRIDSSRGLDEPPEGFAGTLPLAGAEGSVVEVPRMTVGMKTRRVAVIGGAQFRVLPLASIRLLLDRAAEQGFWPLVFLQPADLDTVETQPEPKGALGWVARAGEAMRRVGRDSVADKLDALTYRFCFEPLETVLEA